MKRGNVQYQLAWPPFSKSIIGLAVAFFVCWLLPVVIAPLGAFVDSHLMLTRGAILQDYEVWTLLTYALFHDGFIAVLFTSFVLWVFGAELQRHWSTKKWWGVQIAAVLLGGLTCFLVLWIFDSEIVIRSYHAPVMALVFAYCWLHWREPLHFFFFAMTGRTMLLVFLGFGILMGAFSGYWPIIALDLSGVLVGFLASTRTLNLRDLRVRFRNWKARRHLKMVRSPEDKPNGKQKPNGKSNGVHLH